VLDVEEEEEKEEGCERNREVEEETPCASSANEVVIETCMLTSPIEAGNGVSYDIMKVLG
jgi:hypothetical protein